MKTNAVVNEEVAGADIIAKLKMENRRLEEQVREMQKTNTDVLATERKLANLRTFVFSATANQTKYVRRLSSTVDDHRAISIGRDVTLSAAQLSTPLYLTSKDDWFTHQSSCGIGSVFLHALKVKAKQVKGLQAKLKYSKPGKKRKDEKQKRDSFVKLAQSSDGARRNSLIAEARCLHAEQLKIEAQNDDDSLTEVDQLESKLAHAKSLIDGLEHQIDDLSLQKNDALVSGSILCFIRYSCSLFSAYRSYISVGSKSGLD